MLKRFLFLIFLLCGMVGNTQTKLWVSTEKTQTLQEALNTGVISSFKPALPSSKRTSLQKVYEVETEEITSFLQFVKIKKELYNPQVIESFEPLFDPNDITLNFTSDYTLDLINAREAWDITKGRAFIEIGVFDTNFDTIHEELSGKYSFYKANNNTNIINGTAVAITAAGKTNNGIGKSSIGYNSGLRLYRMNFNDMLDATYSGVRILNISWAASCTPNPYYQDVINEIHSNGSVIVAAAGNGPTCGGPEQHVYPASYDNVISVTSIDQTDRHQPVDNDPSSCHQHNDKVDLAAPGYNVPLSIANNQYLTGNGSSFAAPVVSGVIGLMLAVNNCLTPDEIEQILKETAVDITSQNPQFTGLLGSGRVDAKAAVERAKELNPIHYSIHEFTNSCNMAEALFVSLDSGSVNNHTIHWSNGSNDWALYDLTDDNYSFAITNSDGCFVQGSIEIVPNEIEYDYENSVFISDNAEELIDQNQDGLIRINGVIIIDDETQFSLTDKTLEFSDNSDLSNDPDMPQSGIVIMPGAKLSLENVILRQVTSCSQLFGGIEVLSDQLGNRGELEMNNCIVENSQVAVSNIHKSRIGNLTERGGKVEIRNSTFKNNQRSIYLEGDARANKPNKIIGNLFVIDSLMANTVQIALRNGSVYYEKNRVEGNSNLSQDQRGTGLLLKNAYLMNDLNKPNYSTYHNQYTNLSTGIIIDSCTANKTVIHQSLFDNNRTGILIRDSRKVSVKLCDFQIPSGNYPNFASGILQTGNSQSKFFENYFEGTGSNFNLGIHLIDQLNYYSTIHSNKFEGSLRNGIKVKGKNLFESLACNDFGLFGDSDIHITDSEITDGELINIDSTQLNSFTSCGNVLYNIHNEAENFLYLYEDAIQYLPSCTAGQIYTNELQINVDRNNQCEMSLNDHLFEDEQNESVAGVEDYEMNQTGLISPNPNNGEFNINVENILDLKIYNSTGKQVYEQQQFWGNDNINLDLSTGVYSIVLQRENGEIQSQKMIINQ